MVAPIAEQSFQTAQLPAFRPLSTAAPRRFKAQIKRQVIRGLHTVAYGSGLSSLYARVAPQNTATVLMYHSIPAANEVPWLDPQNCVSANCFERQMAFLASHRRVISLQQLVEKLEAGTPFERGTVVLTFDDGYRNNLTVAAPILAKYQLPATLHLATHYIDTEQNQWIDTLYGIFRTRSRHSLDVSTFGLSQWQLEPRAIASPKDTTAYRAIARHLINCLPEERDRLLTAIHNQLAPAATAPRLTLSWDEVRAMRQRYPNVTLGVHTANHIDLRAHSDRTDREMQQSIARVLNETGERPQHFAFPYNRENATVQQQVAYHLRAAVTMGKDPVVRTTTSSYAIPRLEGPQSTWLLRSWTNGGFPDLNRRMFGCVWIG